MLKNGANPNGRQIAAPLAIASERNNESIVILLLEHGANPNSELEKWDSPCMRQSVIHALCISCKKVNASVVGRLLTYGAHVDVVNSDGNSPLHLALSAFCHTKMSSAADPNTEVIDLILSKSNRVTVNIINADGETPLCLAVRNGLHDVIVKLLELGADVNATSSDKHPLIVACEYKFNNYSANSFHSPAERNVAEGKNIIELLLMHKATVNIRKSNGKTPLFIAVENDLDDVVDLLLKYGADAESFMSGNNRKVPLCLTASKLNERLIQLLVQHGGKVNTCDDDGNSPLHLAVSSSRQENRQSRDSKSCKKFEVVAMLIELGATVDAVNKEGKTPLYLACEQNINLTKLLLAKGANPNTPPFSFENSIIRRDLRRVSESTSKYPLSYAVLNRKTELVELLLENGAALDNSEADG